jgi:hypothetical protein
MAAEKGQGVGKNRSESGQLSTVAINVPKRLVFQLKIAPRRRSRNETTF